jgi:excinuclease ABC subunit A
MSWCLVGSEMCIRDSNLDIVKVADYLIDVGPEGGREGGMIVGSGTPEEFIQKFTAKSHTAKYLKLELEHMQSLKKK